MEEVLAFFAEDAVMRTEAGETFSGRDEIQEWVEFEFDAFSDFDRIHMDFEVLGEHVRHTVVWGREGGSQTGGL